MVDITDALIQALVRRGVKTVYGVPGDFVLGLFKRFEDCPEIEVVCTAGEEGAAFAADAEARLNGLGVVMITYGVGALKILNAVGGAHAECSPVLVISGAPGINSDRKGGSQPLIHHSVYQQGDFQTRMFSEVTVASASLNSAATAVQDIDMVLDGIKTFSKPGYLQIPRDRIARELPFPISSVSSPMVPDRMNVENLLTSDLHKERAAILLDWMRSRERPVVLSGVHIQRYKMQDLFLQILEREGWMCATSLTGKTLIAESHPLSLGIYNGAMTSESVNEDIRNSDGILMIGFPMQDIDTGMFTMDIQEEKLARVDMNSGLTWAHSNGEEAKDELLLPHLLLKVWSEAAPPRQRSLQRVSLSPKRPQGPFTPKECETTLSRVVQAVGAMLVDENTVLLAEVGDSLFASAALHLPFENSFLTSGFWCSLGFVLPGAIGAWFANKQSRPIVLIGDGSFLMSAIECAPLARYNVPAIVIVLDNEGYGTERPMIDGEFNDVQPVDHAMLAQAYGFKKAHRVTTEFELQAALTDVSTIDGPTLLSVKLGKFDFSDALMKLTGGLKKRM
ncbi:indolepyruvate decarboxylase [Skeletonema marinoi]|uniref:Indolepyruvate decarboxylase n=1 Tax=Skeletonema marinoi TaxID=267567 RepID=A0AAD8Y688_9STRA|nr:indolepyruvate decarboxylase [Skeletonema marinoi]